MHGQEAKRENERQIQDPTTKFVQVRSEGVQTLMVDFDEREREKECLA